MLEAVPPFARLQLDRATNLNAAAFGFRPSFDEVPLADLCQIKQGLLDTAAAFNDWCAPATKADLLNALADFADMLQVPAPGEAGIELYAAAMEDFPFNLLQRAKVTVAKSHRFNRLPLPYDFIRAIEPEKSWIESKRAWVRTLIVRFTNAIDDRQQKELPL